MRIAKLCHVTVQIAMTTLRPINNASRKALIIYIIFLSKGCKVWSRTATIRVLWEILQLWYTWLLNPWRIELLIALWRITVTGQSCTLIVIIVVVGLKCIGTVKPSWIPGSRIIGTLSGVAKFTSAVAEQKAVTTASVILLERVAVIPVARQL